jgi:hypothetical protein
MVKGRTGEEVKNRKEMIQSKSGIIHLFDYLIIIDIAFFTVEGSFCN